MKQTKDEAIRFRVNGEEKKIIEKISQKKGFRNLSEYIRYKLGLSYEAPAKIKFSDADNSAPKEQ
jgi:hypothetical protein